MIDADDKVFVEDIREGQEVASPFLINDLRLGQTKAGNPFVGLKLLDRTGRMEGRVWNRAEEFFGAFKNGDVAWVRGVAESFKNQVQLKVIEARALDPDGIDPSHFLPSSPIDPDDMMTELSALLSTMTDPHLAALMRDFLSDDTLMSCFRRAPAAKRFHHAYVGGLLEHTLSICRTVAAVSPLYPNLDRDLMLAGAVLHDMGKIEEFGDGLSGDYTDEGRLLGHILIGLRMLEEKLAARPDFPGEKALLLKHLVVSHHGENELGSPKRPKILEALALNLLDDLDAKMNGIGGFIDRHADEETGWTDYNRLMERFFYRPANRDVPPPTDSPLEPEAPRKAPESRTPDRRDASGPARQPEPDPNQLSFLKD